MWAFIIVLALMIPLIAVILDSQLGRALAGRLERGTDTAADGALGTRVATLEGELERLNGELRRLEEETEFLHRLLENKPGAGSALPPGDEHG